jgi:hypothetical protein
MRRGLAVQQQLDRQPGGRTILDRLEVFKLGVRVATLDETIRKLDQAQQRSDRPGNTG